MEYLGYIKLRSEMDSLVSDVVWFNESAQVYLSDLFGRLLPKVQPSVRVLSRNAFRCEDVRVSHCPGYEPEYVEDVDWCGYLPTYDVELRVGHSDRMVFHMYHFYGCLELKYVDHVGNVYDSTMLRRELKEFLQDIYEEVGKIHGILYNEASVCVDDIDCSLYENQV